MNRQSTKQLTLHVKAPELVFLNKNSYCWEKLLNNVKFEYVLYNSNFEKS